ncbi:hypothetical protein BG011_002352 [Mortierella polycephala]|uniref:Uncharacterized protein n=1 Tax=Mortierella polycephala TaxID=41804 RepID=A0A9P6Q3G5_9FUNG|nr:hypothetical protein BG011_002352 [Mortierella polycephala]
MTIDDSTMQKLWKLTNELTAQLVFNRNATLELRQQLADLKEIATRLREENSSLQARLVNVGAIARKAVNDEYYNTESIIEALESENQGLREMLGVATDNMSPLTAPQSANRVSFPSTNSYMASSGSDREIQRGNDLRAPSSEKAAHVASSPTAASAPFQLATDSDDKSTSGTAPNSTMTPAEQENTDEIAITQVSTHTQEAQGKPVSTASRALAGNKGASISNSSSSDSGKGRMKTNASTGSKKSSRANNVSSTSGNNNHNNNSNNNNNNSLGSTRTKKATRKQKT